MTSSTRAKQAGQAMGVAALILGLSVFVSRLMGLVRDKVIAHSFGASLESDIYFASFVIPDFLNYLLAGGYFSITLIPLLAKRFEADEADGWRFFSAALFWIGLTATACTALAYWQAPYLASLAAPGFDAAATARLAHFLRIILPAQVFFLLGACVSALLYLRRRFTVPALSPLIYNGMIIGCGAVWIHYFPDRGMEGFAVGVTVGSFLGNFLLPVVAAARGGLCLRPVLTHPGLKAFFLLALPLMLGQSVVVLDEQFVRIFGSLAQEGAVSWLNYARRITFVPIGVVAQAAGLASYPFLAALVAKGDEAGFGATLETALTNAVLVVLPLTACLTALAEPTVGLVFSGGAFTPEDAAKTVVCLRVLLLAVPFWTVQQLMGRAFYARSNTLTPTLAGSLATLCALPLYWQLGEHLGAVGIALASTLGVAGYACLIQLAYARKHGRTWRGQLPGLTGASLLLSLAAGGVCRLSVWAAGPVLPRLAGVPVLTDLALLTLGGVVFLLCYLLLGSRLAPGATAPAVELGRKLLQRVKG